MAPVRKWVLNERELQWLRGEETGDLFEDVNDLKSLAATPYDREILFMAVLIKIKLLRDFEVLHAVAQNPPPKVPEEILWNIIDYMPRTPVVASDRTIRYKVDHSEMIQKLRHQIGSLFTAVHKQNANTWPRFLGGVLEEAPGDSPGDATWNEWEIVFMRRGSNLNCSYHDQISSFCSGFRPCSPVHALIAWREAPEAVKYISDLLLSHQM